MVDFIPCIARAFWKAVRSGSLSISVLLLPEMSGEVRSADINRDPHLALGGECLCGLTGGGFPHKYAISSSLRICFLRFLAQVKMSLILLLYPT